MTVLVMPYLGCNLRCAYCFRGSEYDQGEYPYDLKSIESRVKELAKERKGDNFVLHGGEPTAMPKKDFERCLRVLYSETGRSSIQTNGYAIDGSLLRMFKKYKTAVGVSVDGPPKLNLLRGFPENEEANKRYNQRVIENIRRMQKEGLSVGIICVLSRVNAGSPEKVERLERWLLELRGMGIKGGRLNPMWTNDPSLKGHELTSEELGSAWGQLFNFLLEHQELSWSPMREYTDNLLGLGLSPCHSTRCDYFCTRTLSIMPDGELGLCDRVLQEGALYKSSRETDARYQELKVSDCAECRYFEICGGGCPAEGAGGDWRNKTRFCGAKYSLYEKIEKLLRGLFPRIKLAIDIPNYFEEYYRKGRKLDFYESMRQSVWRGGLVKRKAKRRKEGEIWHTDGTVRHGDSGHGDWNNHADQ